MNAFRKLALLLVCICFVLASVYTLTACEEFPQLNELLPGSNSNSGTNEAPDNTPEGDENNNNDVTDGGDVGENENECTHRSTSWSVVKDVTCIEDGTFQKTCNECGASVGEIEIVKAPGHNVQILNSSAATCIDDGFTAGKKCTRCA